MPVQTFVFAPANEQEGYLWLLCSEAGEILQQGEDLHLLRPAWQTLLAADTPNHEPGDAQATAPVQVVLIVPGEAVLATCMQVPTRSRRQMRRALPYLVEEYLAEDLETMHLCFGEVDANNRVPVRALRAELMQRWLQDLHAAGLQASRALTDCDVLPQAGHDEVHIWLAGSRALMRLHNASCALEPGSISQYLAHAAISQEGTTWLNISVATDATSTQVTLEAELRARYPQLQYQVQPLHCNMPDAIVHNALAATAAPELLVGDYARQAEPMHPAHIRQWWLVAGLLLTWAVLQIGLDMGRKVWLQQRTSALQRESMALFQQVFPERSYTPNPRRELEGLQLRSAPQTSFLKLLGAAASALQTLGPDTRLGSIYWHDERGDLVLELSVSSVELLDRFRATLDAGGYPVTVDSVIQEASNVRARIRMQPGRGQS